jgi:hypothetical protein
MIKLPILSLVLFFVSCTSRNEKTILENKIKQLEKGKYNPTSEKLNELKDGDIIYFVKGITEGIDRGRFPTPIVTKDIDTSYFQFVKEENLNDGADGGSTYYYTYYTAIKKGNTTITVNQYDPQPVTNLLPDGRKAEPSAIVNTESKPSISKTYKFLIK